jgi:hypothetical protein
MAGRYDYLLDEAAMFGERFPDQTDSEVLLFIREMFPNEKFADESIVAKAIIIAYEGKKLMARKFIAA